jgi:hypothetical protein
VQGARFSFLSFCMTSEVTISLSEGASPRSTVLISSDHLMTTSIATMNEGNKLEAPDDKLASSANYPSDDVDDSSPKTATASGHSSSAEKKEDRTTPLPNTGYFAPQAYASQLTPQIGSGYYVNYASQQQVTPEPPSPAISAVVYDAVGSFFHQPTMMPHASSFGPPTPLSPPRATAAIVMTTGGIPPPSPLFPRTTNTEARQIAPPSPGLAYMSPPLSSSMYHTYQMANSTQNPSATSPEENGWERYVQRSSIFPIVSSSYQLLSLGTKITVHSKVRRIHKVYPCMVCLLLVREGLTVLKKCCLPRRWITTLQEIPRILPTTAVQQVQRHKPGVMLQRVRPLNCSMQARLVHPCCPDPQALHYPMSLVACGPWDLMGLRTFPHRLQVLLFKLRLPTKDRMELTYSFSTFLIISQMWICFILMAIY